MEPPEITDPEYRRARDHLQATPPDSPGYTAALFRYAQAHQWVVRRKHAQRRGLRQYGSDPGT